MKNLLITGGAGFIGSNLANFFLKQGYQVTIFDNFERKGTIQNLLWLKAQFPQVTGIYAIILAVIVGVVAGYLGLLGLDIQSGIGVALASSGVYTIAKKAGGQ